MSYSVMKVTNVTHYKKDSEVSMDHQCTVQNAHYCESSTVVLPYVQVMQYSPSV